MFLLGFVLLIGVLCVYLVWWALVWTIALTILITKGLVALVQRVRRRKGTPVC
jgi:hypothetical protein